MYTMAPAMLLKPFIEEYVLVEGNTGGNTLVNTLWGRNEMLMLFHINKTTMPFISPAGIEFAYKFDKPELYGLYNHYMGCSIVNGAAKFIVVKFSPAGWFSLYNIPSHLVKNQILPIEDVLDKCFNEIDEKLCAAANMPEMKNILDCFFLKKLLKLRWEKKLYDGIAHAHKLIRAGRCWDVLRLADEACMSRRNFEMQFQIKIGLPARQLIKSLRFHNAVGLKIASSALDWTGVAYECGYYDQNHLVKDFKTYTGKSPALAFKEIPPTFVAPTITLDSVTGAPKEKRKGYYVFNG
jgi:AraC-like DNA-binding protein